MRHTAVAVISVAALAWVGGVGGEISHLASQAEAPIRAEIAASRMVSAESTLSGAVSAIEVGAGTSPTPAAALATNDPAVRIIDGAPAPAGYVSAGQVGTYIELATAAGSECVGVQLATTTGVTSWALLAPVGARCVAGAPALGGGWAPAPPSAGVGA